MKWIEERAKFQKRFDDLSQENIQAIITELNKAVGNYISKGGISQDPNNNPDYNTVITLTQKAETIKKKYSDLNDEILKFLSTEAKNNDLSGLLSQNGDLQKQITRLGKVQDDLKVDVESAIARDEILRSRNTNITRHQLFLLDRPIRKSSIPYLWAISVLFIGLGLVLFKMSAPTLGLAIASGINASSGESGLLEFISNKMVLGSLLISAIIVILFLSLKIAGVFGK